ncbi:MAG TPA: HD domain-containing phosphohydrolase [bacterium]|nr:HD domain-containing phosphohydrolase [bacterium]HPN42062.1 HD domain-containing phosphohydrolase [bacterium]
MEKNPKITANDLEEHIREHDKLRLLLSVTRNISRELEIDRLLMLIMDEVKNALNCDRCSVFLVDREKGELWSKVAHGEKEIRFPSHLGIAGYVASSGEILNIKDAYADYRFNPDIDRKTGYKTFNMLNAPLRNQKGEIIGVFQTLNKKGGAFTVDDEELLSAIAVLSASQIENAQLYEEQRKTFDSFVETLASTIDARDPLTSGHSQRITMYAEEIGKLVDLDDQEQRVLRISSLLHDYGKIAIRESILTKASELTQQEYEHIKEHPNFTKSILERINFSRDLADVPLIASSHHEKLDGSGYPKGLKGDDIPKLSRIIAVADIFDALSSRRHYRDRMPLADIFALLHKEAGSKYDAVFIEALQRMRLDKLVLILEQDDIGQPDQQNLQYLEKFTINDLLDAIKTHVDSELVTGFEKYYLRNYLERPGSKL